MKTVKTHWLSLFIKGFSFLYIQSPQTASVWPFLDFHTYSCQLFCFQNDICVAVSINPSPLFSDHFMSTARYERILSPLPSFTGSSLICVKHTLILRYRCHYPHSLKKHSRLISYSVVVREWRISFIFLFCPICQYVTWCHNTEP